jgi:hypothetical protein
MKLVRLITTQLPSSTSIIEALNKIIKAFESPIEIEVTKTRWEEIKKLQNTGVVVITNT